ncbi:MAG: DUF4339 domain-containing protein [Vicinamibacteria bacterium]
MSERPVRERWFWAQARQRRGPCPLVELVERVLAQPDPASVLVWRKGLPDWTRAENVPELRGRLRPAAVDARRASGPSLRPAAEPAGVPDVAPAGSNLLVYGGIALTAALLALAAWRFWPRETPSPPVAPPPLVAELPGVAEPSPSPRPAIEPAGPAPAPTAAAAPVVPGGSGPSPASVASVESALPSSELRKLRGVAAWSGDRLRLMVINGTAWRVTEVDVRLSRFDGQELVEDPEPLRLQPPGPAVDEGMSDLLKKVAPDRRRPGVNPLDTGPFEGAAGARPENFSWVIVSARGYPPR